MRAEQWAPVRRPRAPDGHCYSYVDEALFCDKEKLWKRLYEVDVSAAPYDMNAPVISMRDYPAIRRVGILRQMLPRHEGIRCDTKAQSIDLPAKPTLF